MFRGSLIVIITNFVVASVGIKRVICIWTKYSDRREFVDTEQMPQNSAHLFATHAAILRHYGRLYGSQLIRVMSSVISLPSHNLPGQA